MVGCNTILDTFLLNSQVFHCPPTYKRSKAKVTKLNELKLVMEEIAEKKSLARPRGLEFNTLVLNINTELVLT